VQVQGLQGAPQHNGKHGRVLRFDAVKGRYQVELASEPDAGKGKPVRLLIKAVNLSRTESSPKIEEGTPPETAVTAAAVESQSQTETRGDVAGDDSRPELGLEVEAEVEQEPEPEPEPEPEVTAGTESEAEQLLPAGCAVQVQGLQGALQHNGKHGRVLRFDAVKGRYQVELASEPPPPRPSSSSQGQVERVEVAAARTGKGAKGGKGKPVRLLIKAVNLSRVKSGQRIEEAETPSRPDSSESASETASAPEYANEIAIEDIGCTPGYRENLAAQ
jgi:hypothetical protein